MGGAPDLLVDFEMELVSTGPSADANPRGRYDIYRFGKRHIKGGRNADGSYYAARRVGISAK